MSFPTFASALKSDALTPGVLAIFWPTVAKILQFGITAICIDSMKGKKGSEIRQENGTAHFS